MSAVVWIASFILLGLFIAAGFFVYWLVKNRVNPVPPPVPGGGGSTTTPPEPVYTGFRVVNVPSDNEEEEGEGYPEDYYGCGYHK